MCQILRPLYICVLSVIMNYFSHVEVVFIISILAILPLLIFSIC